MAQGGGAEPSGPRGCHSGERTTTSSCGAGDHAGSRTSKGPAVGGRGAIVAAARGRSAAGMKFSQGRGDVGQRRTEGGGRGPTKIRDWATESDLRTWLRSAIAPGTSSDAVGSVVQYWGRNPVDAWRGADIVAAARRRNLPGSGWSVATGCRVSGGRSLITVDTVSDTTGISDTAMGRCSVVAGGIGVDTGEGAVGGVGGGD